LDEDFLNSVWTTSDSLACTYDSSGNLLTVLYEEWENAQLTTNTFRLTNTYDTSGNMRTTLEEDWDSQGWANVNLDSYTYDANGSRLADLVKNWAGTGWENSKLHTYTYDASRNPLTELLQVSDGHGGWANENRIMLTYDANENIVLFTQQVWNSIYWEAWPDPSVVDIVDLTVNGHEFSYEGFICYISFDYNLTQVNDVRLPLSTASIKFDLAQNYPNPFNPSTTIRYSLPHRSHASLAVFNTLGQKVAELENGEVEAGYHEVTFNGKNLASGMYFYRLQAGYFVQTKKLLLLR
jgi:hypothetical protein